MAMCTYGDFLRMADRSPEQFAIISKDWIPVHNREANGMFKHDNDSRVGKHWTPQAVVCFAQFYQDETEMRHSQLVVGRWIDELKVEARYDPHAACVWYFKRNVDAMQCELTFSSKFPFHFE